MFSLLDPSCINSKVNDNDSSTGCEKWKWWGGKKWLIVFFFWYHITMGLWKWSRSLSFGTASVKIYIISFLGTFIFHVLWAAFLGFSCKLYPLHMQQCLSMPYLHIHMFISVHVSEMGTLCKAAQIVQCLKFVEHSLLYEMLKYSLAILCCIFQSFISFNLSGHLEEHIRESEDLPDYLSDDSDTTVVEDKAVKRPTKEDQKKSSGWFSAAANFLSNSFYWWFMLSSCVVLIKEYNFYDYMSCLFMLCMTVHSHVHDIMYFYTLL